MVPIGAAAGSLIGDVNLGATIGLVIGAAGALFFTAANQFKLGQQLVSLMKRVISRVLAPLMLLSLGYLLISNLVTYLQ